MANAVAQELSEVTILRKQNQNTRWTVQKNVEGISHEESLIHPHPAGNSMNWVIGHLVCIYGKILPALGQQPVIEYESVKRYDRGSAPITSATALQSEVCSKRGSKPATAWTPVLRVCRPTRSMPRPLFHRPTIRMKPCVR